MRDPHCEKCHARIESERSTIQRLEAALRFYADNAAYCKIFGFKDDDPRGFAPVLQDDGKIARAALGKK